MDEARLHISLLTPERRLFEGEADFLVVPGLKGEIGILPRHAPYLGALGIGEVRIRAGESLRRFALHGGVIHILRNQVSILAEAAEARGEIDAARARRALEETLAAPGTRIDPALRARLERARARLKVAGRPGQS